MSFEAKISNPSEKAPDSSSMYDEYMKQLRQWAHDKDCYYWMWRQYLTMQTHTLHMHVMSQMQLRNQVQSPPQQSQVHQNPQNNPQIREYAIPSVLRRSFAEIVDCLLLLAFKVAGILFIIKLTDLEATFSSQTEGVVGVKLLKLLQEDVSLEEFDNVLRDVFSDQDLKAMENELSLLVSVTILYRFLTGIYEWLFIWMCGATPGKYMFGLTVLTCSSANLIRPNVVVLSSSSTATCTSSLLRALLKNVMISLMIPGFLTAFFHPCKRTTYDELSRTIVVQRPTLVRNR